MRFLLENIEKYYRLEIEGYGSFYRSIDKIIKPLLDDGDDDEYELALNLDGLVGDLQSFLYYPDTIKDPKVKFAYTEDGFNEISNYESYLSGNLALDDIKDTLDELGYNLIIKEVQPKNIVYRDKQQIGYIE